MLKSMKNVYAIRKFDILKLSQAKLFATNTENEEIIAQSERINELGIQMLLPSLYNQLFKHCQSEITDVSYQRSKNHLECHKLLGKPGQILPGFEIELPPLQGKTVLDHFNIIGALQCSEYMSLLQTLISKVLPPIPNHFAYTSGWTKYFPDGNYKAVSYPDCNEMVFDTEVCVTEGDSPTIACAASSEHWYSWCSDRLVSPENKQFDQTKSSDLIPFGNSVNKGSRIVVGHNVSFDRKFIKEQYLLSDDGMRFLDTMSLHIATSGLAEGQKVLSLKNKSSSEKIWARWMKVGCLNNLAAVYNLYCKKTLSKEDRDIFVKGTMSDIRENFQLLTAYCCKDVQATHEVLCEMFPIFLDRFPHPVTLSGMLSMGQMYLPVSGDFERYIASAENEYEVNIEKLTIELRKQAVSAVDLLKDNKYKDDIWLWSLDWIVPPRKVKLLQNYPTWFRKLCQAQGRNDNDEPQKMSLSLKVTPLLLRLTWNGYPLHFDDTHGWGFLKPSPQIVDEQLTVNFPYKSFYSFCKKNGKPHLATESGVDIGITNVLFTKLPHKDGESLRVGNPLAGNFLHSLEDGTLSGANEDTIKVLIKATKMAQYWKGNRARVLSQKIIWWNEDETPMDVRSAKLYNEKEKYGAILPQVITAGTVTRRSVEKTWMTAANANIHRVGSELKAMVRPPPGYYLVGADVDSEELWIASLLGDANFTKIHGCTALSWMTLQGNKADGTDMHSHTAKLAGITRSQAKIVNYARIYGAGVYFMKYLLRQFNDQLSEKQASLEASQLYSATRGEKAWNLTKSGKELARQHNFESVDEPFTTSKIKLLMKRIQKSGYYLSRESIIRGAVLWHGGSESHMFNALESIANAEQPRTPFLNAAISRALEPDYVNDGYVTSRVNWVVQSSAVDYLHLILVSVNWLFSEYDIKGRLSITIHDEIQFMVPEEDKYRAALALHISNLLTRVFFAMKLGMNDLPQSVAFFSSVDVDRALRKDPTDDCVTPSNKHGLSKTYSIPAGESLTIEKAIQKTNGSLRKL